MSKIAGKRTKRYPRFRSEIGDISLNLFPQVAGGFALLPYAATLCGTQRTENRRYKIAFRLLPLDGSGIAVPSFQLHSVFGTASSQVPSNDTASCFIGFRDKSRDGFKNPFQTQSFELLFLSQKARRTAFGGSIAPKTPVITLMRSVSQKSIASSRYLSRLFNLLPFKKCS